MMIIGLNLRDKTIKDEAPQAKAQVFSGRFSSQSTGLLQTLLAAEIAAIFLGLRVRDDHPIAPTAALGGEVWAVGVLCSRERYPSTFLDWKKQFARSP
jgi:hypothetical protein